MKLKKYLYSCLKQAGGYNPSETDSLVFLDWINNNGNHIIMCIHVDDFVYVVSSNEELLLQLHEPSVKHTAKSHFQGRGSVIISWVQN